MCIVCRRILRPTDAGQKWLTEDSQRLFYLVCYYCCKLYHKTHAAIFRNPNQQAPFTPQGISATHGKETQFCEENRAPRTLPSACGAKEIRKTPIYPQPPSSLQNPPKVRRSGRRSLVPPTSPLPPQLPSTLAKCDPKPGATVSGSLLENR